MAKQKEAWDKLSMLEKALLIKLSVDNGVSSLKLIRDTYNLYSSGGKKQSAVNRPRDIYEAIEISRNTPYNKNIDDVEGPGYREYMWKLAQAKSKVWGISPEEAYDSFIHPSEFNYRRWYNLASQDELDNTLTNGDAHWMDVFGKTVGADTFSNESPYSGYVNPYNPKGITGGTWIGRLGIDEYIPSESQIDNNWPLNKAWFAIDRGNKYYQEKISKGEDTHEVPSIMTYNNGVMLPEITVTPRGNYIEYSPYANGGNLAHKYDGNSTLTQELYIKRIPGQSIDTLGVTLEPIQLGDISLGHYNLPRLKVAVSDTGEIISTGYGKRSDPDSFQSTFVLSDIASAIERYKNNPTALNKYFVIPSIHGEIYTGDSGKGRAKAYRISNYIPPTPITIDTVIPLPKPHPKPKRTITPPSKPELSSMEIKGLDGILDLNLEKDNTNVYTRDIIRPIYIGGNTPVQNNLLTFDNVDDFMSYYGLATGGNLVYKKSTGGPTDYPEVTIKEEPWVDEYFKNNTNVAGMAIGEGMNGVNGDRRVIINPYNTQMNDSTSRASVLLNERLRHVMDQENFSLPNITKELIQKYNGTSYLGDTLNIGRTEAARYLSGDPSYNLTGSLKLYIDSLKLNYKKSTGGPLYPFSFEKNPFLKTPVVRYDEGGEMVNINLPEVTVFPEETYITYTGNESKSFIPTKKLYNEFRANEIRRQALVNMNNRNTPHVPYINDDPTKPGSSCLYTFLSNYPVPLEKSNRVFWELSPEESGFKRVDTPLPGDGIQVFSSPKPHRWGSYFWPAIHYDSRLKHGYKFPSHMTMFKDIDTSGVLIRGSNGSTNPFDTSAIIEERKPINYIYPENIDIYRFIGTQLQLKDWEKEYNNIYKHGNN